MGAIFSPPHVASAAPAAYIPPPPAAPTGKDAATLQAEADAATATKKAAAAMTGYSSTLLTSGMGDTSTAPTQAKTLLGQ